MFQVSRRSWLVVTGLVVAVATLAPKSFAASPRLVAQIDEPFEINGQLFPAGKLSLREVSRHTPVSSLHELQVDGRCFGMVLAQEVAGSPRASEDEMIFERSDASGHLVLVSVAHRGQSTRRLYAMSAHPGGAWVPLSSQEGGARGLLVASNR